MVFYDNYEKQDFSMEENVSPSKSKSGTNYYRIKKDSRVLGSLEGKYLALNFGLDTIWLKFITGVLLIFILVLRRGEKS